jgi:hypothetical protein
MARIASKSLGAFVVAFCAMSLATGGTAGASSSVDQYTNHLPTPGGGKEPGGRPTPHVDELQGLSKRAQRQFSKLPYWQALQLATIASARELGAPGPSAGGPSSGSGGDGFPLSAVDAFASGPGLALLCVLAATAGCAAILRRRWRRQYAPSPRRTAGSV